MNTSRMIPPRPAGWTAFVLCLCAVWFTQPPAAPAVEPGDAQTPNTASPHGKEERVSLAVARDRAQTMHDIYVATLDVIHQRYFHGDRDRAVVPARAMEDVFAEVQRQSQAQARWIAVNIRAMSIDHEPESEFERRAARELSAGKQAIETVEEGFYRRASVIPLTAGCISCHGGVFKGPGHPPQYAGLVISIPIRNETADQP